MVAFKEEIQKSKSDGTCKIMIRMTHNRKIRRIPTSIVVNCADITKSGKIKDHSALDGIDEIIRFYRKKCNALSISINYMSVDEIYDFITKKEIERIDFLEYFREYINANSGKKSIRNYKTVYNKLESYVDKPNLWINEITVEFLRGLEKSINGERAVSLYMSLIRTVFYRAKDKYNDEERGIVNIPYSPFKKYEVPKQNVAKKRAIDLNTIKSIYKLPYQRGEKGEILENRRNLAKDMFLLSFMLIGMNSVDIYNCKDYEDGIISYNRTKTKERRYDNAFIKVKVPNCANPIFQRYKDKSGKRVFNLYMRYSNYMGFNRSINLGLKKIGKELGIKENLQFYAARHSWATIARNEARIDKATVNEALNHVDEIYSVTDLYIKKDFSNINKANSKVMKLLLKD